MRLLVSILLVAFATTGIAQQEQYSSITFKRSVWSSSSYVGDLSDWVYFGDGTATVLEYKAPEDSFNISASIRQTEEGDSELEALVGAIRFGGYYLKLETGGAEGALFNPDPSEPLILPKNKIFKSKLNLLALGSDWSGGNGVKVGYAWVNLVQPAEIDLTYYTVLASGPSVGSPIWAESAVDPEFDNNLIGIWLEVDSLKSFLQGKSTFYSNPTINGPWIRGYALDVELVAGAYFSDPSVNFGPVLKDAYGLKYQYVDSVGVGWMLTYKLAYNLVYKKSSTALGVQVGIEGRAFQVADFSSDETVSSKDQVFGKIGIGDNSSYQWGPYIRLAMEF